LLVIPDNVDSKYRFVILSALRARQIQTGSAPLVDDMGRKATTIARQELVEGLVQFSVVEKDNLLKK
jgi:DNA-directed RNA polymerase omega subunit